jgi:hypothetical protein
MQNKLKLRRLVNKIRKSRYRGVTPIIATILILAIVIAGVVIGFVQILPYIEGSRVETGSASVQSSLIKIDNIIWDMISDSSGYYFPDSVPSRKLQVSLPIGSLKSDPNQNRVIYEPMLCPSGTCPGFNTSSPSYVNDTFGALLHSFSSNYALIPENSLEYLTGADPFIRRDMVAYVSLTSAVTEEQSSTNLTLYRKNNKHFVELSYRPKVFVTQSIVNGFPTYNIGLFFIKIKFASSFVGTTNVFLKLTGTNITETTLIGSSGDSFQVLFSIGGLQKAYAEVSASLGGFSTYYRVSATTYEFSISG